ncbi:thioredoxin family protein [Caldimonas brevitalea]|uniref:Thioredoxin n=1 Tax=Caldimonas brevitalea TaxID=413882 RepID=A0A0G3BGZ9_9BURK|nr:thioredoxin family protein [Caldimonas brevitalea]AKJ28617.1 thioredoxin [Caldimonas brevitalea]
MPLAPCSAASHAVTHEGSGDALFARLQMQPVAAAGFDAALAAAGDALVAVYFWGDHCFNCERFKQAAEPKAAELSALRLHWLQANVYTDTELGRRFSLHGVPSFYFFHRGKKLGRITSWPGLPAFTKAVEDLYMRIGAAAGP